MYEAIEENIVSRVTAGDFRGLLLDTRTCLENWKSHHVLPSPLAGNFGPLKYKDIKRLQK